MGWINHPNNKVGWNLRPKLQADPQGSVAFMDLTLGAQLQAATFRQEILVKKILGNL